MANDASKGLWVMVALVAAFVAALVVLVVSPAGDRGAMIVSDVFYILFSAAATTLGVLAVRHHGRVSTVGRVLLLLTITMALDTLGGVVWAVYEIGLDLQPFPSAADGVWALFYVMGVVALVYALRRVWSHIPARTRVVVAIVWVVLVVAIVQYVLRPIFMDTTYSPLLKLLSVMYLIGDALLLLLAGLLFAALRRGAYGASWLAFLAGFGVYAVADLVYTFSVWQGTYVSGRPIDALWYVGHALFAYGFYRHAKILR
ncbi:MAG: hypothetical protein AABY13_03745 [Nanoarchaeota archaeon]